MSNITKASYIGFFNAFQKLMLSHKPDEVEFNKMAVSVSLDQIIDARINNRLSKEFVINVEWDDAEIERRINESIEHKAEYLNDAQWWDKYQEEHPEDITGVLKEAGIL